MYSNKSDFPYLAFFYARLTCKYELRPFVIATIHAI